MHAYVHACVRVCMRVLCVCVCVCVRMCLCMCVGVTMVSVCPPRILKTMHVKHSLDSQSNKSYCINITLVIDNIDGWCFSDEVHRKLLLR